MTSGNITSVFRTPRLAAGRRRNRRQGGYYEVSAPGEFSLKKFAKVKNLHAAYRILERDGGHGAGIDHLTFEDFSRGEVFASLRQVSAAIQDRTYLPYETLPVPIPKGDGRFRELQLHRIMDRTVHKALQLALDGFWRPRLPGIGRSTWHIYARMQRAIRERQAYILAIDDIRNCFPSVQIEDVFNCHIQHITQPDLLWLIDRIIRGHDGPNHTIGLAQGSPYSPIAMELMLHTCFDTLPDAIRRGFPLLLRYVDNLTFVCHSERESQEILLTTADILSRTGLTLKGQADGPQDIRDPDFNTPVLGLIPKWQNGQLNFSIPDSSYEDLEDGLINTMNHPQPTQIARSVIKGWIEAMGPAFASMAAPEITDRILNTTRRCGFREISIRDIRETASSARKRWIRLSQAVG